MLMEGIQIIKPVRPIQRPVPLDDPTTGWKGWKWNGDLQIVDQTNQLFTVYERQATLTIDEKEAYLGARHSCAHGRPFKRVYIVPTNLMPCGQYKPVGQNTYGQNLGKWNPESSSWFSYWDTDKLDAIN